MSDNKLQNMLGKMEEARAKELGLSVDEYRKMLADKENKSREEARKYLGSKACEQGMERLKDE
ncbi:hypothetical protein [Bacillus sp. NEAU-Y102]